MTTQLEKMAEEKNKLTSRIVELEAQQAQLRAGMAADPMKAARALAPQFAAIGIEIEVLKEALGKTIENIKAEQARLASPQVKADIKRAEKLIAENKELRARIGGQVSEIVNQVNDAMTKASEAAQLLKSAGLDTSSAQAGMWELSQLNQLLNGWTSALTQQVTFTANVRQAEAARKAKAEASAKEAAEAQAKAKAKAKLEAERREAKEKAGALGWLSITK